MRRSHTSRNMGKNMLVLPYKTVIPVVPSAGTVVETSAAVLAYPDMWVVPSAGTVVETQQYYDRMSMLEVVPSAGTVVETKSKMDLPRR